MVYGKMVAVDVNPPGLLWDQIPGVAAALDSVREWTRSEQLTRSY